MGRALERVLLWHRPESFGRSLVYVLFLAMCFAGAGAWRRALRGDVAPANHNPVALADGIAA